MAGAARPTRRPSWLRWPPTTKVTCLDSYDTTCFPRGTDWSFTRFFIPNAVRSGYRLAHDSQLLWNAFDEVHNKNGLPGV